jgi:chromosome segregation protein
LVYIKRIDLRGFKTFGKKVSLSLDRGLTVITGANGSGKSNVMDSVKFTLGELSAKEMRGGSLGDLISKTGEMHTRSAYAAIQFDNSDRRIPIDSDLVTVSREFVRGGEGIYRVNGRRIPRKQLTEILSSAGVEVTGFNIVPQHAVTRLAEVTPEERRKIVEDMIGIAVYDAKKAESEVQLQQADINLKVASAKVDEVRSRVESLERERNNLLRYNFLKNEVSLLEAIILSNKIRILREETLKTREILEKKRQEADAIRQERDRLLSEKASVEEEKQKFEQEAVDHGTARVLEIEHSMGDLNAEISRCRIEIRSNESNLQRLENERREVERRIQEISQSLEIQTRELTELRQSREALSKILDEKARKEMEFWNGIQETAKSVDVFNRELQNLEDCISQLSSRKAKLEAETDAGSSKLQLISGHLKTLESRRSEYEHLIEEIAKRSIDLDNLRVEEQKRLQEIESKIQEYAMLKETKIEDIHRSKETVEKASATIIEFEAQRSVVQTFGAEEKALQAIEDMGRAGAIEGIIGRIDRLVKVPKEYHKAVEAASAGWMKALVVRDAASALQCIESLKRTKMGRIKIVPLREVSSTPTVTLSKKDEGVIGPISNIVEVESFLRPAVNFVFGDTVLTGNQRMAYLTAANGVRAVSISGEVYEADGGIEGGYYREPFDFGSLIAKAVTVENLEKIVKSLENLIAKGEEDANRLQTDIESLRETRVNCEGSIAEIEREIANVEASLQRSKTTLSNVIKRIEDLSTEANAEKSRNVQKIEEKEKIEKELEYLVQKRDAIKSRVDPTKFAESQQRHLELSRETSEMQRKLTETDSKIGMIESSVKVLEPNLSQMKQRISEIDVEKTAANEVIEKMKIELNESTGRLSELENERRAISEQLATVRSRRDEFQNKLRSLESAITALFGKYEQLNSEVAQLSGELREKEIQNSYLVKELEEHGRQEIVSCSENDVKEAGDSLSLIKRELEEIGAVNQLALNQHEEQKDIYKQLSVRINELSQEKLSIIGFMNELEKKKYETFMNAFSSVNKNFQDIFARITNGGSGRLQLENVDDPFKGGVDVYLRFPGKAELSISSASGGEKSVATVCFVLALQAIHPMPFYMFDEIDAHLDVVNTQKLAELLKERAKGSQFIIISLRDITISRADRIYGIYIQNGVSQAVSLPVPEART